jgi:hypothetical protein
MSNFALAFPTSWTVEGNDYSTTHRHTHRQPEPRPDSSSFEPSRDTTIRAPETHSLAFSSASKYPTDFPSSWLFSSGGELPSTQLAASSLEETQRQSSLTFVQGDSTRYSTLSDLSSSSMLRPTVSAAKQPSPSADGFGYQGPNLKEKLLQHIAQSSLRSSPKPQRQPSSSKTPCLVHRQSGDTKRQAKNGPGSQADSASRPSLSIHGPSTVWEPAQAQYDDESDLSDGSGAGDVPYQLVDFSDNYSIITTGTALTK